MRRRLHSEMTKVYISTLVIGIEKSLFCHKWPYKLNHSFYFSFESPLYQIEKFFFHQSMWQCDKLWSRKTLILKI